MKQELNMKCGSEPNESSCKIESIVSIDDRGQMVLPKDIRARLGIQSGDKLVLVSWEKDGEITCLSLIKTDKIANVVKDIINPIETV